MAIEHFHDEPTSLEVAMRSCCPRCGEGKLFKGFLTLADRCDRCGLDLSFAEPADGPAFFVMTGIGIVVIALFAWIAVVWQPPIWFHFVTVFPALILGCLGTLRPVKAWLVAEQYIHKAEEGQWASLGGHGEGGFGLRGRAAERQSED